MTRMVLALGVVFALTAAAGAQAQVGALQTDCTLGGRQDGGGYQFVATCAGRAPSPDGRYAIVQKAYEDHQPPIEVQDASGRTLARLKSLSDDMPFSVTWAPGASWFFVNHHVGSFMDQLQIFEVVGRSVVERPALIRSAVRIAAHRYPCLRPQMVLPNGVRWVGGGRRLSVVTISRVDACSPDFGRRAGVWRPLWMIGDVRSGRVDPGSIHVQPDGKPFQEPKAGAPIERR